MLCVGDRVTNNLVCILTLSTDLQEQEDGNTHVFKEDLENTTGLLVDETGDTLHTTTTSETTDGLHNIRKGLDDRVHLSE